MKDIRIERIIIVGVPAKFSKNIVNVTQGGKTWEATVATATPEGKARSIVIRDPKVAIGEDWEVSF
jgi:hypothetical protein